MKKPNFYILILFLLGFGRVAHNNEPQRQRRRRAANGLNLNAEVEHPRVLFF